MEDIDLKDYLRNSIVTPEARNELIGYVNEAYFRILSTLKEIPDIKDGKLLEIGANPYFLTLLIKKFRNYEIYLTNYFGDNCNTFTQIIKNDTYNEEHIFNFYNINIEKELLPYPDENFDVVVFCEVMEHLTEDPIFALYNIYRVLKKGGILIFSTPNVYRHENIKKYLFNRKLSIYDPYSGYGIYGRHNREYSLFEIEDILSHSGFEILHKSTIYTKEENNVIKKLAAYIATLTHTGNYILVRARKKEYFNWYYPEYLYRGPPKKIVIDNFIIMGKNCSIQLGDGWNCLEKWENGGYIRWTKKRSIVYLKASEHKKSLCMSVFSTFDDFHFNVSVYQNCTKIGERDYIAKAGWQDLSMRLSTIMEGELTVEITVDKSWCPKELGINEDVRELGVAVNSIGLL